MGGLRNASTSICLTPWKVRMLTVAPTCDGFLCHHAQLFGVCLALCCVVDLEPCLPSCPGNSVGRAPA